MMTGAHCPSDMLKAAAHQTRGTHLARAPPFCSCLCRPAAEAVTVTWMVTSSAQGAARQTSCCWQRVRRRHHAPPGGRCVWARAATSTPRTSTRNACTCSRRQDDPHYHTKIPIASFCITLLGRAGLHSSGRMRRHYPAGLQHTRREHNATHPACSSPLHSP